MRDTDGRQRQFVVKSRKEPEYDEPAVRRRRSFAEEEDEGKARPGFFARRSLREREEEEAEEARLSQRSRRRAQEYYDSVDNDDEEEDEQRKAPKVVRIFSWIALLVILFAIGYLGANYFFSWADKKGGPRVGEVYGSGTEVTQSQNQAKSEEPVSSASTAYTLYIPENGKLTKRGIDINKGLTEDDIEKVASMYIDTMKESNQFGGGVRILSVFQSGDWLYLDMTADFQSSIKKLGKDKGAEIINGLVTTMAENFPPIKKVKFYIAGKESAMKNPADLTQPWESK